MLGRDVLRRKHRFDLALRVFQHNSGTGARYTACRRPVEVVWAAEFTKVTEAYAMEKKIQNWSRAKREALIEGRFKDLPALSRSKNGPAAHVDAAGDGSSDPA